MFINIRKKDFPQCAIYEPPQRELILTKGSCEISVFTVKWSYVQISKCPGPLISKIHCKAHFFPVGSAGVSVCVCDKKR